MRLRIFTCAYNAMPFVRAQYNWLQNLNADWTWAVAEGPAKPTHCSSWRASVPVGKSPDGTAECLDSIAASDPRVIVKHQNEWDGINSMNNACLPDYTCLLMQMAMDEVWPLSAIEKALSLFDANPDKTVASVPCQLYVTQELVAKGSNFGCENEENFRVLWRFEPGLKFISYEPPLLSGNHTRAFTRQEMHAQGVYFDHLQWFCEKQARQKEDYYSRSSFWIARAHQGITERWKALQARQTFPSSITDVFPWAPASTVAVKAGLHPFSTYFKHASEFCS
jgi:hypothetical protein